MGIAKGYRLDGPGFKSRQAQEIQLVEDFFSGVKLSGCKVDHSFLPVPTLRMTGDIPLFHLHAFMAWRGQESFNLRDI